MDNIKSPQENCHSFRVADMVKAEATEDEVGLEAAALYDKLFCSNSLVDDCSSLWNQICTCFYEVCEIKKHVASKPLATE